MQKSFGKYQRQIFRPPVTFFWWPVISSNDNGAPNMQLARSLAISKGLRSSLTVRISTNGTVVPCRARSSYFLCSEADCMEGGRLLGSLRSAPASAEYAQCGPAGFWSMPLLRIRTGIAHPGVSQATSFPMSRISAPAVTRSKVIPGKYCSRIRRPRGKRAWRLACLGHSGSMS